MFWRWKCIHLIWPVGTFDVEDGNLHITSHPTGSSAEQVPLLTAEAAPAGPSASKEHMIKVFFKFLYEKLKLKQIIQPAIIASDAMIPCILFLVDGPGTGSAELGLKTTAAIIFGRLALVPPTGLGIVTLADRLGFLPPGAVANLRGCGKEAASILFWVHIFAVFSMAGWITLYLNILF